MINSIKVLRWAVDDHSMTPCVEMKGESEVNKTDDKNKRNRARASDALL